MQVLIHLYMYIYIYLCSQLTLRFKLLQDFPLANTAHLHQSYVCRYICWRRTRLFSRYSRWLPPWNTKIFIRCSRIWRK